MERYFIIDKLNTYYDLHSIVTSKKIAIAEPKTNYVKLDGRSGTLDLSESLTGELTYDDRTISASFWTDYGTRDDREKLLNKITSSLHGKKVKIIEPDDPDHYFIGRVKIKDRENILPYAKFSIEATCDPWRYAIAETIRTVSVNSDDEIINVVLNNNGVKTISPVITVTSGHVLLHHNGNQSFLPIGSYTISDLKLHQGANIVGVSAFGTVTFSYQEADL